MTEKNKGYCCKEFTELINICPKEIILIYWRDNSWYLDVEGSRKKAIHFNINGCPFCCVDLKNARYGKTWDGDKWIKSMTHKDYAHELQREEIISDFLNEFCKKESYVGEIFNITPKELLTKFAIYYTKRMVGSAEAITIKE